MPDFPLNKSMFMRAERTAPSAWFGHIPFAGWLIESFRPRMFVELGTHHGTSYLAFCQAIVSNDVSCKSFAVDTWTGDEHAGEYGEEVYEQLDAYHSRKYGAFSKLMRMTFDEAAGYFENGSIDLLHVDGLHTYEAVKHDFETWFPKLSQRAVVLFHDTCVRERGFGVWKFFAELFERYPSFEFTHAHGLGVVLVGSEVADEVRILASLPDQQRAFVQDMFARLGDSACELAENDRLRTELAHATAANGNANEIHRDELRELFLAQEHALRLDMVNVKESVLADARKARIENENENKHRMGELRELFLAHERAIRLDMVNVKESNLAMLLDVRSEFVEAVRDAKEGIAASNLAAQEENANCVRDLAQVVRSSAEEGFRRIQNLTDALDRVTARLDGNESRLAMLESLMAEQIEWQQSRRFSTRLRRLLGLSVPDSNRLK